MFYNNNKQKERGRKMNQKRLKKLKETKEEKRMLKNKNGITLIALVVTIVVLLILAGVSISLILDNNGIIQKRQRRKRCHTRNCGQG